MSAPMTCGDWTAHEAHTKIGDGRPCDGVREIPDGLNYAIGAVLFNVSNLPFWMQAAALGRDMGQLRVLLAGAVLDSDWLAEVRQEAAAPVAVLLDERRRLLANHYAMSAARQSLSGITLELDRNARSIANVLIGDTDV